MISKAIKDKWTKQYLAVTAARKDKQIEINDWESSFLISVGNLLNKTRTLTMQQSITLNRIYGRLF